METIYAFFSSKSQCFNCHKSLRFKRIRQCQTCSINYVEMLYCRNCSSTSKSKTSKKTCMICNSNESIRSVIKPAPVINNIKVEEVSIKSQEDIQAKNPLKKIPTKLSVNFK